MKIPFLDGVIEYHEHSNKWSYEIGDNTVGFRDSLTNAKLLAANHAKAAKTFDRHPVLFRSNIYSSEVIKATVTSYLEEPDYRGNRQAWITKSDKSRMRASISQLFEDSTENDRIVVEIDGLRQAEEKLQQRLTALSEKLIPYKFRTPTPKA